MRGWLTKTEDKASRELTKAEPEITQLIPVGPERSGSSLERLSDDEIRREMEKEPSGGWSFWSGFTQPSGRWCELKRELTRRHERTEAEHDAYLQRLHRQARADERAASCDRLGTQNLDTAAGFRNFEKCNGE